MKIFPISVKTKYNFNNTKNIAGFSYQKPDIFNYSNVYFGVSCTPSNFKIKDYREIPCASCGMKMVQNEDLEKISDNIAQKTGDELIKTLSEFKDVYKPIEASIVEDVIYIAGRNKSLKLDEIIKCMNYIYINELRNEQVNILDKILEMSKSASPRDKKVIESFVNSSKNTIFVEGNNGYFKRKSFINTLQGITNKFQNKQIAQQIMEKANSLPTSSDSVGAFSAKYSRRSAEEIAKRLIIGSLVTTEHIKPQSLGGANDTDNYILKCGNCNSRRGNMPYSEWFKQMPDMPKNLQRYVNSVYKNVPLSQMEGYEDYLDQIIKTFKAETKGQVRLNKPRYKNNP